jgi:hypothetical protein
VPKAAGFSIAFKLIFICRDRFSAHAAQVDATLIKSINSKLMRAINALAARRGLSVLVIGLLAFGGSATIGLIGGIAEPRFHDEFSYLLAADTFVHGRLTNPTHPMWVHFENIHIINEPTYMSKYPPGQGAILALGQMLTGYPIVGVWLSMALMCAATCWMLHAWVPARWALFAGLFALLNPIVGISGDWAQSYWGGALAATGGAMVLGGMRNLIRMPKVHHAVMTGLGVAILANSRPFEGLILTMCVGVTLSWECFRRRRFDLRLFARRIVAPVLLVVGITAVWMGYYNYRVTNNVFRLPYQVHEATYGVAPLFVWQNPVSTPEYRHYRSRKFHTMFELPIYSEKHSWSGFFRVNLTEGLIYFVLTFNILMLPLLFNLRALIRLIHRNRWARTALLSYSMVAVGIMLETYAYLHYWAPVVALNYYFGVQAMRLWRRNSQRVGRMVLPAMMCLATILLIVRVSQRSMAEASSLSPAVQRANLLARLESLAGKHLVLVSYGAEYSIHREWVYNGANIDAEKVVFAHQMGLNRDCELVNYFKDRSIWSLLVEREERPVEFEPFPRNLCR